MAIKRVDATKGDLNTIRKYLREKKRWGGGGTLVKDLPALGRLLSDCQRQFTCKLIKYVPHKV